MEVPVNEFAEPGAQIPGTGAEDSRSLSEGGRRSRVRARTVLKVIGIGALVAIVVAVGVAFAIFGNEIRTFASIREVRAADLANGDGAVYAMDVAGDFYFDEYLAQGGASSDAELIDFITNHITKGLISTNIEESDIKCSSFTAKTPAGDRLFGRNYDFSPTNTCLVSTNPGNGRHASISTVDLQFIGVQPETGLTDIMDKISALAAPFVPLDGMNDAGVACGIYMTNQGGGTESDGEERVVATDVDTEKPDLTSTTMLRMVLDYADSVDEAVDMIEGYDLHDSANTSFHYMIADASGKSAILEWIGETDATDNDGSARHLVVTYHDADDALGAQEAAATDYQWVTNFIVGDQGYYANEDEMGGLDRYRHLGEVLSATDGTLADADAAMDLLRQVGRRTWDPAHGKPDSTTITVHSVVYDLTNKRALWVPNEHYDDPTAVQEIALD